MILEIDRYFKLFDAVFMLSPHHFKSRNVSFDSATLEKWNLVLAKSICRVVEH